MSLVSSHICRLYLVSPGIAEISSLICLSFAQLLETLSMLFSQFIRLAQIFFFYLFVFSLCPSDPISSSPSLIELDFTLRCSHINLVEKSSFSFYFF